MSTSNKWENLPVKLDKKLLDSLNNVLGFNTMMPVQQAVIPHLLQNRDVAVEAATGSGKTLAFLLPVLHILNEKVLEYDKDKIYAIILAPTRELANQIYQVAEILCKNQVFTCQLFMGGTSTKVDVENHEKNGSNIIIGSPGKLKELFELDLFNNSLKELEILIMDEADRLMDNEYEKELTTILEKLPKQRRTGLFSATLQGSKMQSLFKYGLRNPVQIQLKRQGENQDNQYQIPDSLQNIYIKCDSRLQKIEQAINFVLNHQDLKIIIFVNTCASVDFYGKLFQNMPKLKKMSIHQMHGQMKQKKRNKIFNDFCKKSSGIIICTDVIARGIDFQDVKYILQLDPPQDPSFYIHRIGRTARVGKDGTAILFLQEHELQFISYLQLKNVGITEREKEEIVYNQEEMLKDTQKLLQQDRDLIEKSKRAFVSFVRSYKEHDLKYIFEFNKLQLGDVANSFFSIKIPRVKEILGKKIENFVGIEIENQKEVQFKDKNQGKQFEMKQENSLKKKQKVEEKQVKLKNLQVENYKNNKSLRKKVKQENDMQEFEDVSTELRLAKKLKQGKIDINKYNVLMRELEGEFYVDEKIKVKQVKKK